MCHFNLELNKQIENFLNIKKNNTIKEFCSASESIKNKMSANGKFRSGDTLILIVDMTTKKFENFLDESFKIYTEVYDGKINKIYTYSKINTLIDLFNIKRKEIEKELNTRLNEELNLISNDAKAKKKALMQFTNTVNSIRCIYAIRIKTYLIYIVRKSRKNNILAKLLMQTVPALIGVIVGFYLNQI